MSVERETLERRLRDARSSYAGRTVSPDAWQENQRRLGRGSGRGSAARSRGWLAAAAVAVLVTAGVAVVVAGDDGGSASAPPAAGPPADPFVDEHLIGPPVEFGPTNTDAAAIDQVALVDPDGNGPQLCVRYRFDGGTANGCHPREDDADEPSIAFDWLGGTLGDGSLRGVVAGVDERVDAVEVWLSNGHRQVVEMHPGGWGGTRLVAFSRTPDRGIPQRLVAYTADRLVLQSVDLPAKFGGDEWLAPHDACSGDRTGELVPSGDVFPHAYVAVGTSDARITHRASRDDTGAEACIEQLEDRGLAGWQAGERLLVVVTAPEVTLVRLELPEGTRDVEPRLAAGAPWGIAQIELPARMGDEAVLVAFDQSGQTLDRGLVTFGPP